MWQESLRLRRHLTAMVCAEDVPLLPRGRRRRRKSRTKGKRKENGRSDEKCQASHWETPQQTHKPKRLRGGTHTEKKTVFSSSETRWSVVYTFGDIPFSFYYIYSLSLYIYIYWMEKNRWLSLGPLFFFFFLNYTTHIECVSMRSEQGLNPKQLLTWQRPLLRPRTFSSSTTNCDTGKNTHEPQIPTKYRERLSFSPACWFPDTTRFFSGWGIYQ